MNKLIPLPKIVNENDSKTKLFSGLNIVLKERKNEKLYINELIALKMWDYKDIKICIDEDTDSLYTVIFKNYIPRS